MYRRPRPASVDYGSRVFVQLAPGRTRTDACVVNRRINLNIGGISVVSHEVLILPKGGDGSVVLAVRGILGVGIPSKGNEQGR